MYYYETTLYDYGSYTIRTSNHDKLKTNILNALNTVLVGFPTLATL